MALLDVWRAHQALAMSSRHGAASSQNAGAQPNVALCHGKGVKPSNTQPQANQVPAMRFRAAEGLGAAETWCMAESCSGGTSSLRAWRLTVRDSHGCFTRWYRLRSDAAWASF